MESVQQPGPSLRPGLALWSGPVRQPGTDLQLEQGLLLRLVPGQVPAVLQAQAALEVQALEPVVVQVPERILDEEPRLVPVVIPVVIRVVVPIVVPVEQQFRPEAT